MMAVASWRAVICSAEVAAVQSLVPRLFARKAVQASTVSTYESETVVLVI